MIYRLEIKFYTLEAKFYALDSKFHALEAIFRLFARVLKSRGVKKASEKQAAKG
jgi:hypothetical protein